MKKKFLLSCILCCIVVLLAFILNLNNNQSVKQFSISEYKYEINYFSTNSKVCKITNANTAMIEAENLWVEMYGNEVKKNKPYSVSYDSNAKIWLVEGNSRNKDCGGVPYTLIKTNGKVLAIWHDK